MKIAFLNLYGGINNRGAESFAHELADRLGKFHEVKVFRGIDYGVLAVQPTNNLTILKLLFLDGAAISVLRFSFKIFGELWRGNYDWIVPMNGFWQVILCKLIFKSKILITGHSGPGWDEKWNLWLKPDVFVATTEPTAKWAKKVSPWTNVVRIPYGVDIAKFVRAKPVGLDLERPIVLCPAAAVPYKRIDLAIRAMGKLEKGSLLHLGTGPLLTEIKKLGSEILGSKRFRNITVEYEDIPSYYAACDLVTLPSATQENSPMVFLEAMAAGKMVVTTPNPRSEWILGSMGQYVDPENIGEYAAALKIGLEKKVSKNEIARFSWDNIARNYLDLLRKMN